jgi:hypothetical protein
MSPATWVLGVAIVLTLGYVMISTLRTGGTGSRGPAVDRPMPPFAAPLASSDRDVAANLRVERDGKHPAACEVDLPDAMNSCDLARRGPVVLAFLIAGAGRCVEQVDRIERLRARFPDVQFAVVSIGGGRDALRRLIAEHGWGLPVAHDPTGAVANAYAVAVCPTVTFAAKGGTVRRTALGAMSDAELVRDIEAIR